MGLDTVLYRFGRRTLYLAGCIAMAVVLLITGGLSFSNAPGASWGAGVLLICLNLVYNSTLGPVCYTLISEVGSTRLRGKTVALARVSYQIMNIICGIIVPRMLSPTSWNWGQKSAFFWFGSCALCIVYVWFRVPETRGRSYAELDTLFENHVPAWKFSSTKVDRECLDSIFPFCHLYYSLSLLYPSADLGMRSFLLLRIRWARQRGCSIHHAPRILLP